MGSQVLFQGLRKTTVVCRFMMKRIGWCRRLAAMGIRQKPLLVCNEGTRPLFPTPLRVYEIDGSGSANRVVTDETEGVPVYMVCCGEDQERQRPTSLERDRRTLTGNNEDVGFQKSIALFSLGNPAVK